MIVVSYTFTRVTAGIAKQKQSNRVRGLHVTTEDEVSRYRRVHVPIGELPEAYFSVMLCIVP